MLIQKKHNACIEHEHPKPWGLTKKMSWKALQWASGSKTRVWMKGLGNQSALKRFVLCTWEGTHTLNQNEDHKRPVKLYTKICKKKVKGKVVGKVPCMLRCYYSPWRECLQGDSCSWDCNYHVVMNKEWTSWVLRKCQTSYDKERQHMMMMVTKSEVWFSVLQRKNSHDDGNNQLCKEMRLDPTTSQSKLCKEMGLDLTTSLRQTTNRTNPLLHL